MADVRDVKTNPVADPLGYYRQLGLKPSSDASEVKTAFRRLAQVLR